MCQGLAKICRDLPFASMIVEPPFMHQLQNLVMTISIVHSAPLKTSPQISKKTMNIKNPPRKDMDHRVAGPPRVGGRRWSPPGGSNPPPTEGVRSVLDNNHIAFQIRPDHIANGESERPSTLCSPRLLFPSLSLSPGGWGPPEPATKFTRSASCWASWADFLLF